MDARAAAEHAARASYGRLVALLAVRSRDIAAAEDALSEAFSAALRVWPEQGVPDRPEAWLLTAARRRLGHGERSRKVHEAALPTIEQAYEEAAAREAADFPDDRLKLLFVCAHPAIDAAARTPLMLQTVLGLDAARIAAAFVVPAATMSQRLVRAKAKIREAGIAFETPGPDVLAERLDDVLSAIYVAYGTGWDAIPGADDTARGLTVEAIYLGRLAAALAPNQPEAKGLLALMLYCEARAGARRGPDGAFIPLSQQNAQKWSRDLLVEAEAALTQAARFGQFGRFQCEAAIQSLHMQRGMTGAANWPALLRLYDLLAERAGSLGAAVARAAAYADSGAANVALAQLDALPAERTRAYQPYWATRAHVLTLLGEDARPAREQALVLTSDPAVRAFLSGAP